VKDQVVAILHLGQGKPCNLPCRLLLLRKAQNADRPLCKVHRQQRNRAAVIHGIAEVLPVHGRHRLIDRPVRIMDQIQPVALHRVPISEQLFRFIEIAVNVIRCPVPLIGSAPHGLHVGNAADINDLHGRQIGSCKNVFTHRYPPQNSCC